MADEPQRPRRNLMALLSLFVGWIHLIFASMLAIGLIIYLSVYYQKSHDDDPVSPTGMPSVIFLCLFSVASLVFDILLIRGISEMRISLIGSYVYVNKFAVGVMAFLSIVNLVRDIANDVPAGRFLVHRILHALILITMMYLVYPVYLLHKQMRATNQQTEHFERRRLSSPAPVIEKINTLIRAADSDIFEP